MWAVEAIGSRLPFATCLSRSLTLQALLVRRRIPADIRFGVLRQRDVVTAHAWVEQAGRVVIGDLPDAHYATLERIEEGQWRRA